ncbi:MAG: 2-oxoacid:ferredoxin oxidoreductase subunit alpha [Conexivisphaerales archaeon]
MDKKLPLVNSLNWKIGGAQGSGVDSSARIYSRAVALAGLWVFGTREYYSNIKGLHSYFEVRVDSNPIQCKVDRTSLLASFDAETLIRHATTVEDGGGIVYNKGVTETSIEKVDTINKEVRQEIQQRLTDKGLKADISGILEESKRRGIHLYPIPYDDLVAQTGKRIGEQQLSKLTRIINVLAVSVSSALLGIDKRYIDDSIRNVFSGKQRIIDMNVTGAQVAYEFVSENYHEQFPYKITPIQSKDRLFISGNEAVALGKLVGGCRMQTYYPITPASDESEFLEAHENFDVVDGKNSILVVQTEDEIAAITMAIGAALTGTRASASTSGPGFSLMVEGMGWSGINEVPVVITLYSRGGPSTGMPTRTEQGDLKFVLNASHGEFPRIVLCSGDIEECFYDTIRAFNYAEKYQLPVIHLVDKAMANTNVTVNPFDTKYISIERGKLVQEHKDQDELYRRFKITDDGISPRAFLGMSGFRFWNTGDEHDELGHINEEPENRVNMMNKRMRKLETADTDIPDREKVNFFPASKTADITIVSWGSSKGAILEAMKLLKNDSIEAEFLQVRIASPFPTELVKRQLSKAKLTVAVEQNYSGQMASLIAEKTGIIIDNKIVKYNGRPISLNELYAALKNTFEKPEENRRVVLTSGA